MRARSCVCFFFLLFVVSAQLPSQEQRDPFQASTVQGRTWTNTFFGMTWELPKGLQTNLEQQAMGTKLGKDEAVQRMRASERQRGVLLSGTSLQATSQLFDARTTDPTAGSGGSFSRGREVPSTVDGSAFIQDPRTERSYWVMTKALSNPPPLPSLVGSVAENLRQQPGVSEVTVAAEPVRFGGQDFYQTDWRRQYESYFGKYAMYSRGYTTLRNGYEITFSFRADSKKGVEALARSMESLKFEEGK